MECPKCGHKNRPDAVACSNCYFDLHSSRKPVTPVVTKPSAKRPATPVPPPAPAQTGYQPAPGPVATAPPPSVPAPPGVGPAGMPAGGPAFGMTPIMDYAGFWRRFAATFVDAFILLAIEWLIFKAMGVSLLPDVSELGATAGGAGSPGIPGGAAPPAMPDMGDIGSPAYTMANGICTLMCFLYYVIFYAVRGATPGKMALGIKIVKVDGSPISAGTAVLRVIAVWILSCVTIGITYLAVAFTQKKQGFHDMAAGTVVIRSR